VKDGRIVPKTWVLALKQNRWCPAELIEPLCPFVLNESASAAASIQPKPSTGVLAQELRRFPAFSALSNQQLDQFIGFGELVEAPTGRVILRREDPSDSVFFLLSGELRARVMVGHEDKTLGRVKAGECFGETAMFMRTSRTADVVVEKDARMLRVTSEVFLLLIKQLPQIAAPVLFGMAGVMAGRICEQNQKNQRKAASELLWR
jgi:signal-transduction protein with cAMP-binding, CBS, and nucleotidyltransferase domain